MKTIVIVAYKSPQNHWVYEVKRDGKTLRRFRKLTDANASAAAYLQGPRNV